MSHSLSPSSILQTAFGFRGSKVLLTAVEFGDAFDYTGADFPRWCCEVGFTRFEVMPMAGPSSAAVAYK